MSQHTMKLYSLLLENALELNIEIHGHAETLKRIAALRAKLMPSLEEVSLGVTTAPFDPSHRTRWADLDDE